MIQRRSRTAPGAFTNKRIGEEYSRIHFQWYIRSIYRKERRHRGQVYEAIRRVGASQQCIEVDGRNINTVEAVRGSSQRAQSACGSRGLGGPSHVRRSYLFFPIGLSIAHPHLHRDFFFDKVVPAMKLSNQSEVPVYTISGSNTARPLPEWLARRRKRSLKDDPEYANRVELLQDFEFEEASHCIRASEDGEWVMSTGKSHPDCDREPGAAN